MALWRSSSSRTCANSGKSSSTVARSASVTGRGWRRSRKCMDNHHSSQPDVAGTPHIVSNADLVIVHALELYMAISVREMEVFRCVMQSGSVTNAASTLNISQPAVSRMLQQAEEGLGFRL